MLIKQRAGGRKTWCPIFDHFLYIRNSSYFEIPLCKSDLYNEVIEMATESLDMEGNTFVLVRASGSVISDQELKFGKKFRTWTIGGYLNQLHLSPNKLHLGVAAVDEVKTNTTGV